MGLEDGGGGGVGGDARVGADEAGREVGLPIRSLAGSCSWARAGTSAIAGSVSGVAGSLIAAALTLRAAGVLISCLRQISDFCRPGQGECRSNLTHAVFTPDEV